MARYRDDIPGGQDCSELSTEPFLRSLVRVLLVDSRPIVLVGLTDVLECHGPPLQVVGQANHYRLALEIAQEQQPDVVVLSLFDDPMPHREVIQALLRSSRVLVLKGMHDAVPLAPILCLGVAGVVLSEQPPESIVRAILQASSLGVDRDLWHPAAPGLEDPDKPQRQTADALPERLTARERELIRAVVLHPGAKYLVIADQLGISEHTVHNHLSSIYQKLKVVNRNDLLVYAVRHGLHEVQASPRPASHAARAAGHRARVKPGGW